METCIECGDEFEEDIGCDCCGICEGPLCVDCMQDTSQCEVCLEKEEASDYESRLAESSVSCVDCITSCDTCRDADPDGAFAIHDRCLAEHKKTCTHLSRSQRKLAFAKQTVSDRECELEEAKLDLAVAARRIASVEVALKKARKKMKSAEKDLAKQQKRARKKTKSAEKYLTKQPKRAK